LRIIPFFRLPLLIMLRTKNALTRCYLTAQSNHVFTINTFDRTLSKQSHTFATKQFSLYPILIFNIYMIYKKLTTLCVTVTKKSLSFLSWVTLERPLIFKKSVILESKEKDFGKLLITFFPLTQALVSYNLSIRQAKLIYFHLSS